MKIPEDYVLTPGGYRHKSLVREIKHGSVLTFDDQESPAEIDKKITPYITPGIIPGVNPWTAGMYYVNAAGGPIISFEGSLQALYPPASNGQTIIMYTSFSYYKDANTNWNFISAIHWGPTAITIANDPNDTAQYWYLASWIIGANGETHYAAPKPLPLGTTTGEMYGKIELLSSDSPGLSSYKYRVGTSALLGEPPIAFTMNMKNMLDTCSFGIEAYNVNGCADYPTSTPTPGYIPFQFLIKFDAPAPKVNFKSYISPPITCIKSVIQDSNSGNSNVYSEEGLLKAYFS